jgi:hypothetical protein
VDAVRRHAANPPRLDAEALKGHQQAIRGDRSRPKTQHHRDAGAIDVGVQKANPQTPPRECHCEIDGNRGLAHTPLAAGYSQDAGDLLAAR